MQKRITALNPGLIAGAMLSILLHMGMFHFGIFNVRAFENKPAEVIMDSGSIAVELTLMPSIASAPTPPEPMPDPEPIQEPEPEPEKIIPPVIPLPLPVVDAPSPIQPQEIEQQAKPEPKEEIKQELPEPSMESIDQDGSLEQDKGAITDAVAQNSCKATYPPLSRRRGEEGVVTLSFDISEAGKISNIQVVKSSGHKRLDKAAIKAIAGAHFNPALQLGKPVASTLTQTINFRLTND